MTNKLVFIPCDSLQRPDVVDLDLHKAAFAKAGGVVQQIPAGVSSNSYLTPTEQSKRAKGKPGPRSQMTIRKIRTEDY